MIAVSLRGESPWRTLPLFQSRPPYVHRTDPSPSGAKNPAHCLSPNKIRVFPLPVDKLKVESSLPAVRIEVADLYLPHHFVSNVWQRYFACLYRRRTEHRYPTRTCFRRRPGKRPTFSRGCWFSTQWTVNQQKSLWTTPTSKLSGQNKAQIAPRTIIVLTVQQYKLDSCGHTADHQEAPLVSSWQPTSLRRASDRCLGCGGEINRLDPATRAS